MFVSQVEALIASVMGERLTSNLIGEPNDHPRFSLLFLISSSVIPSSEKGKAAFTTAADSWFGYAADVGFP